jgi:hypothetical protein
VLKSLAPRRLATLTAGRHSPGIPRPGPRCLTTLPPHILKLWSQNNQIAVVITAPGFEQRAADLFGSIVPRLGALSPDLQATIQFELSKIQFANTPGMERMRIVTLKEHLGPAETAFVKDWAANQSGLYGYLEANDVPFHPTMEELRIAYLLTDALPKAFQRLGADPARSILRPAGMPSTNLRSAANRPR